jgi:hypothetical protein
MVGINLTSPRLIWPQLTWPRLAWPEWRHAAFIGGLGLSAIAGAALLSAAYFAGTAPHLPASAAALSVLKSGEGAWPPAVTRRALDTTRAPTTAMASPTNISLLPHSISRSEASPIEVTDLPPPEPHIR